MRKSIVMSLVIAFGLAVFALPVSATQYDPNNWHDPAKDDGGWHDGSPQSMGDDSGFNDQESNSGWDVKNLFGCFDIRVTSSTLFLYFDLIDVLDLPNQDNGNDRQSEIVPSGGTL